MYENLWNFWVYLRIFTKLHSMQALQRKKIIIINYKTANNRSKASYLVRQINTWKLLKVKLNFKKWRKGKERKRRYGLMTMTGEKKDASRLFPPFWDDVICWSKRHQSGMTNSSFAQKENWNFCLWFCFYMIRILQGRNVWEFNTGFIGIDHIFCDMF